MNAITEWAALPATEMFLRDNRDDSDFSRLHVVWFFEEQKHSLVLMEYLRRFRPDLVPTEAGAARGALRVRPGAGARDADAAFLRRDPPQPLVPARRRVAHRAGHQARSTRRCASDEARHGGAYLRYMKRAMQQVRRRGARRLRQGRRADGQRAPHRAGAAPDQPARQHRRCSRATRSRAACPTRSGSSTGSTSRSSSTRSGRTRSSSASCTTWAC